MPRKTVRLLRGMKVASSISFIVRRE